jgi:hypothetical protein
MCRRPVDQVGSRNLAIGGARPPFVRLKPERYPSPMRARAADGLADPCWKVRIQIARTDPRIEPAQLCEHRGRVVANVAERQARARLQAHHPDSLLRELIAERRTACAGAHDHDH